MNTNNRVQYKMGGKWYILGDYVSEQRALDVAKEYVRQNPYTPVRVVQSAAVFKKVKSKKG